MKVKYYFYSGRVEQGDSCPTVFFSGIREVRGSHPICNVYNQIIIEHDTKYNGNSNLTSFNLIGDEDEQLS